MQCYIFSATMGGDTCLGSLDASDWETARRDALHRAVGYFDLDLPFEAHADTIEQALQGFAISSLEGLAA